MRQTVSYTEKKFYNIGPYSDVENADLSFQIRGVLRLSSGLNVIKLFTSVIYECS